MTISFKQHDQGQLSLLPPSLDELIPENDPVRVVNAVVERLNLKTLEKQYKKTGCSAYTLTGQNPQNRISYWLIFDLEAFLDLFAK